MEYRKCGGRAQVDIVAPSDWLQGVLRSVPPFIRIKLSRQARALRVGVTHSELISLLRIEDSDDDKIVPWQESSRRAITGTVRYSNEVKTK